MSYVFYKFKSQKDPSRVVFDGPSISVFDLKREIISLNKLGAGTDFDLSIYDESTNEEFTDDNYMIPRATSIIVRRLPPSKPGKGNGAKYVSGSAGPTRSGRSENFGRKTNEVTAKTSAVVAPAMVNPFLSLAKAKSGTGNDESAAIAMMMSAQSANWDSQQEKMAMANPVYSKHKRPLVPVPDKPPPQGYICHRCGEKGHWIQACPTNDDPNFDNKPRIKRTTGIPKTFLKKADKPVFDEDGESAKANGVMLDADGQYVTVQPDSKSWATYQAKATAVEGDVYSQPLPPEHKDWECQICGKLVKDATRTPCCKKLYCDQCIQSALLESDFVCPGCGANEVLLQDLKPDEEVRGQIAEYIKKWEEERRPTSPPEIKDVHSSRHRRTHSQELLSPPPQSRKRSRSPTPADDEAKKKVAAEEKQSEASKSPTIAKSPSTTPATLPNSQFGQHDPFNQQFNPMAPFMPMPGMPFPPFPPDPFMMAAMGFPPPIPGMMPGMPPMGNGFPQQQFPQQQFSQYNQQGGYPRYNNQMPNQMYGGENSAYMRRPVNDRGVRRVNQRNQGSGRDQMDYREVI
jgi:protein MPE1